MPAGGVDGFDHFPIAVNRHRLVFVAVTNPDGDVLQFGGLGRICHTGCDENTGEARRIGRSQAPAADAAHRGAGHDLAMAIDAVVLFDLIEDPQGALGIG